MHRFCSFLAVLAAAACLLSAQADEPAFAPGEVVRAFTNRIQGESLGRKPLDGRMSARWLDAFLDRLDPKRMYFLQTDEAEFRRSAGRLDDLARAGDFGFPQSVRERYVKRVGEAAAYAAAGLALRHNYSLDEEFPLHFAAYAADARELRERWRLRIKFELLVEKTHGVTLKDAGTQLGDRYARIARQARDMTDERLCDVYLNSLAACYDPHAAYFCPSALGSFLEGHFIRFTLGLDFRQSRGDFVLAGVSAMLSNRAAAYKLIGWHLLAIRRLDGRRYDLVEADPLYLWNLITFGLGKDTEVVLELMNPLTCERKSLNWVRQPIP